jgi:hypothetical protein
MGPWGTLVWTTVLIVILWPLCLSTVTSTGHTLSTPAWHQVEAKRPAWRWTTKTPSQGIRKKKSTNISWRKTYKTYFTKKNEEGKEETKDEWREGLKPATFLCGSLRGWTEQGSHWEARSLGKWKQMHIVEVCRRDLKDAESSKQKWMF